MNDEHRTKKGNLDGASSRHSLPRILWSKFLRQLTIVELLGKLQSTDMDAAVSTRAVTSTIASLFYSSFQIPLTLGYNFCWTRDWQNKMTQTPILQIFGTWASGYHALIRCRCCNCSLTVKIGHVNITSCLNGDIKYISSSPNYKTAILPNNHGQLSLPDCMLT